MHTIVEVFGFLLAILTHDSQVQNRLQAHVTLAWGTEMPDLAL